MGYSCRTLLRGTLACILRTRHARSPQRVARAWDKSHSRLHFGHSTRAISAEGCARRGQIAFAPAFRTLDTHDLRRGLRAQGTNRIRACISHTRHARSPQRVCKSRGVNVTINGKERHSHSAEEMIAKIFQEQLSVSRGVETTLGPVES